MSALISEPLDEQLASLFPLDLSGDVVALRACVDAGEQDGVFCVAAVAFGYDRAVKANRQWERLMKGRTFHMTDLHARKNEFEGIDDDEVDAIMRGTVGIIRDCASYAVAVSCDAALVADMLPVAAQKHPDMQNLLSGFRSTYGFMCHFAMYALGLRANEGRPGRHISYLFEQGDEGQRGLRKYLEFLGEEPHHRLFLNGYSFNRATVASKDEIEGVFHASDLVAWEWARHVNRHRSGKPIRRSLAEIAGHSTTLENENGIYLFRDPKVYFRHFKTERIGALAEYFRVSLEATTHEEVDAAFATYREAYPGPGMDESLASLFQREAR